MLLWRRVAQQRLARAAAASGAGVLASGGVALASSAHETEPEVKPVAGGVLPEYKR